MKEKLSINQVEKMTGVSKRNIRFYETEGLLLPKRNEENGYRVEHAVNANSPDSVYVVVIKRFVIDHYSVFDEIWIDKNTGETIIPCAPDGKG